MTSSTIYENCPKCGSNLILMDGILTVTCNECGVVLLYDPETKTFSLIEKQHEVFSGEVKPSAPRKEDELGKKRIYFLYLLFGIVTGGVGLIYYLMLSLKDLNNHHTYYKLEKGGEPLIAVDGDYFDSIGDMFRNRFYYGGCYAALFMFTIAFDLISSAENKYSSLYHHLKGQSRSTAPIKAPHPILYMIALILYLGSSAYFLILEITILIITDSFAIIVPSIVGLAIWGVSFLVLVICGAQWQWAFNSHIRALESQEKE